MHWDLSLRVSLYILGPRASLAGTEAAPAPGHLPASRTISQRAGPVMLAGTGLTLLFGFGGGGCPLIGKSETCKCRNMFLAVQSGTTDGKEPGPKLLFKGTKCKGGQQCELGNTVIPPGGKGGVQIGNADGTYATGGECTATYRALIEGYDNCLISFYLDVPFIGSNEFGGSIVNTNDCPKSLTVTLNQYVGGNRGAGVEYYVYYDKNKDDRPGGGRSGVW